MRRLGEILLERHLISELQLAHALVLQRRTGSRLGDILVGHGMIGYLPLYKTLAEQHRLPFVDLLREPPDPALLRREDADAYLRLQIMPWRRQNGYACIAVCDPSPEAIGWIRERFRGNTLLAVTSPHDIRRAVESLFGGELESASRLSLWRKLPQVSAARLVLPQQKALFYGLLSMTLTTMISMPAAVTLAIIVFCHVAYSVTMLFKWVIFSIGSRAGRQRNWTKRLATLDERRLPVYTVLVPMYREAAILPGLLESMQKLDYPASKLDIKLVLEADDTQTLEAARALRPRYQFDIIRVPTGTPRTKPRACNYALRFARGEFITVFDADDRPDRLQLKKAVYMFRTLPPEVVCLQARLNYYNAGENLLTRFFSLEYTILFQFMLYGLERTGIPIPLGGTSNHIALARLKALGEWDPYNVTEDADLGTRLAARGFKTVMLDSYTMEEAPLRVMPWIRQRSRWIKGYMQTWLVHMRDPVKLYRTLGFKSFIGFQFFIGLSSFTFLTAPLVWGLSLLWLAPWQPHMAAFPRWLIRLTVGNLCFNLLTQWYCALHSTLLYRKQSGRIMLAALLYPLYLLLHSAASYKALWQLVVKPHFWEKTEHGLASDNDAAAAETDLLDMARRPPSPTEEILMNSVDMAAPPALKERLA